MTNNYTTDLEPAFQAIRDTFVGRLSDKDRDITLLQEELAKKDAEIKDLHLRISGYESQLSKADSRLRDASKAIEKLALFKQSIMEGLQGLSDITAAPTFVSTNPKTPSFLNSPAYIKLTSTPNANVNVQHTNIDPFNSPRQDSNNARDHFVSIDQSASVIDLIKPQQPAIPSESPLSALRQKLWQTSRTFQRI